MTKQITLRWLLLLLFFIFVLLNVSQKSYSQANITSTVPNLLIACGNNDTFTVTVYNTSTTDTFKNAKLYVSMAAGMRYKAGSVSGSGVSQFNIDTFNKPIFNLPQILPSSNLQITFLASAGCGINTSGLLTNTYTLRYNSSQVYSGSSSSYSAYSASLSINSITNQTGNLNLCYDTLKRNITITNSGNGHITSFLFTITKQSNVIIHNINKGSVTTSGNTYYVTVGANDFKTIGDNDSLFELNESIVIEETVVAGGINNLGESYSLTWGCNSQNCQTVNSSATMTVNLSLVPNLSFTPSTSLNTCYGGSNASNMQLRIINTGSAVANNIEIDIYQTINADYAYRSTYYTRIDQNSFTKTQNGQTTSVSPTSYIATNNHACFNSTQAIGSVTIQLPNIDVGDTVILRWNVYSCCPSVNSTANQEAFGWSFTADYGTPCRTNTFTKNPTTGYTRRLQRLSFNEAISPSVALANQDTTTVGFSFHYFDLFPGTSNRKVRFTISNSNCLNIDSNSFVYQNFAGNKTWPIGSQYVNTSGDIVLEYYLRNIPSGFSMVDSRLLFDVSDNCNGCSNTGGFKTISISVDYIPDPACNCEMTMNSTSMNVPISCPVVCNIQGGIKNEPFNVYRTSYGQPDNDNNGLPDVSGSLDFTKVKTDRAMHGDTIITELVGILSGKHNWKFGYGSIKFGYDYFTDAGTTLKIYDSSRSRYYTVNNMPYTKPSNGEFKYCFSLDSIKTYGGNVPPNFKYKSGDSILLYPKFKVTTNIGGATRWVTVDGENYMSYGPVATTDTAKHFCGQADLIGNINIVGYYFTIYGPNTLYPEACQEFTVYQSYYLSIGPCCNNYAGGNMFPYEYRSWSIPVKALYTIPPGFEFVSASVNYRRTAGDHVTHYTNVPTFAPVDSHSNPLIFNLKQFFDNNTFYPSDDGYHGTVYVTLRPECGYDLYPQNHIFYQFEHRGTTGYMDTSIFSPSSSNPFYNNGPTLSIQGLNTYQSIDSTAQWNFSVTNTSSASVAPNTWLNLSQLSGNINTKYILNLSDNDTIYENNGYFNLGTLGKSITKNYRYVANHTACTDDSISLKTGWHCDTNYSSIITSCYKDSLTFYLNPQPANISMQVYSPDDTTNLCDTIDYEITLNGSQSGNLYDVLLQLKILQGISVVPNSCELLYPLSSSYRPINDPVYKGNAIYEWGISSIDSIIGNHGLSGTSDTARNKLKLKFRLNTNCQVISGNVFEIIARAKHSCGQDISPVTSPSKPILIRGAKQSYISTINILTDTLEICSGSEKIKLRFTNLGPDSTTNADYLQLTLPLGYSYNQNSTQNIIYADSIKEPNIFNNNGYTQLSWELPSGIKNSKYIEYEFSVSQDSVINCGKQAFTFQSVVLDSLVCVATNSLCEFKVQTGVKTDSILIYKPNPQLVSFSATSVVDTPNNEKTRLEIRIINNGKPIISGDTTFVQIFNDKDKSNTLSANDTFLGYLFSTSALGLNDTITFIDTFSIPSGYSCPLIAALIQDTNSLSNCQCDHQETLLNDIPINYDLPDTAFCSGDTISVGVDSISGYQYSWSPSHGIIDQGNKLTRITLTNLGSEPDTVTYTLTTSRGSSACSVNETFRVVVYPKPSVNFSKDKNISCFRFNIFNFWNQSNIDTANQSNIWNIDKQFASNLDSFTYSFTDTGTHDIQLISITNFGCSDSSIKTISINPSPEVDFSLSDTSQCLNGNNFSFSNYSTIKSGTMTYLWRLGNNDTSTLSSFSKTFDSFGLHNITLTATSDLNCKDSVTKAIFISKSPYDIEEKGKYKSSLDSALVAYYPLDYNANDYSGNNYNLSNGGATFGNGIINGGYEFDGINDFMTYFNTNDSVFAPMTKDWTIATWFKVPPGSANSSPKGNIISWYRCGADPNCGANDGGFYTLYYKNDQIFFQARNNDITMGKAIVSTHNTLEIGKWYFVVGIIDQTNDSLHLFIDGCIDSSTYYDFVLLSPGGTDIPFDLGRGYITGWGSPASFYDGFIDEVRVYEKSLSDEEIQTLFRLGRGTQVFCDDTIVCYSDSTVIKVAYPQKDIKYELINLKTNSVVGNSQYGSCDTLYFYTPPMTDTTTFRIKATDTTNLCDIFLDTSFTIYSIPKPFADISINDTSQCQRGNTFSFTNLSTISGGTMTYFWKFGDGDTSINQHENHIYDTNSTFRVSLIATSDLGCIDSIEKYVLVNPHPDIDFIINDTDQCKNGNSFIISNLSTIVSGSTNYLYDFGDGTSSTLSSPTKSYNTEGNYSIKLVGESDFGCKDSLSKNVYMRPNPQVDFSINDTSQCFNGNQFIFTNTTSISGGSYNYSWTTDDTTISNTSPIAYSYSDVDSYNVKLLALSDYSCADSVTKKVYVRPEPNAGFTINDSNQCLSGNLFIFEDSSLLEYGTLNHFWDYEVGDTSGMDSFGVQFPRADAFLTKIVVTSEYGCKDSFTKNIYLREKPTITSLFVSDTVCEQLKYCFTATANGTFPISFDWKRNNFNLSLYSFSNFCISNISIHDSGLYRAYASNSCGTDSVDQFHLTVFESPKNLDISKKPKLFWSKTYGGTSPDEFKDIKISGDTLFLIGYSQSNDSNSSCNHGVSTHDIIYYEVEKNTGALFRNRCFGTATWDVGTTITLSDERTPIITGHKNKSIHGTGNYDCWIFKLESNLNYLWDDSLGGSDDEYISKTIRKKYGGILSLGSTKSNNGDVSGNHGDYDFWLIKLNEVGLTEWKKCFGGSAKDYGYGISELRSGGFVISGLTESSNYDITDINNGGADFWIVKINDTGKILWNKTFGGTNNDEAKSAFESNTGNNIYAFGQTRSNNGDVSENHGSSDFWLIKLDASGNKVWEKCYGGTSSEASSQMIKYNDNLILVGYSSSNNGNVSYNYGSRDGWIVLVDSNGTIIWEKSMGGSDYDEINTVVSDNSGNIYFAGYSRSNDGDLTSNYGSSDAWVAKLGYVDTTEICENDSFVLSSSFSGTEPIYYQWYKNDVAISGETDTQLVIRNSQLSDSGTYYCQATNMCNTATSSMFQIIIMERPDVDFSINTSEQCLNQNLFQFYDSTSMASNDSLVYWWDFGDNHFDSVQNTNHRFTTYDSFYVKFKVTSEYGCADSVQKLAIVRPSPVSNFSINDSGQCLTNNLFAFSNSSTVAYGSNSFKWYFGDNDSSVATNPTRSYGIEDTYTVQLIANSDFGCKDTSQKLLVVYPMPNSQFSINDSNQCFNENSFAFTDQSSISSGFLNYNWNFGDFTTSTNQNPNHTYTLDDTFNVKLVLNSDNGCLDSISKTVYIFPSPVSSFIINDSAQCFNEHAFTFTNHTSINSGTLSYFWDLDDGNTSTQTNVNHNYAYDDTFNVKLVNTSDLGCKDSLTKKVYLFPSPQLDFAINDSQQCFNENNFVFTNNSLINTGSQTFLWNFGDFNTSTATSPTRIYNFDDTLTVTLFANSNLNCADTLEKTVYIFPSPVSSFIINDSAQCFNEHAFTFTNHTSINSGTLNYFWNLDDGNTSTQTNVSHNYAYDDTFNVKLVNTSDLGCKDSLTKKVYLFPSPQLDFAINDSQQCFNENNFVFTNNSLINTGSQTFLWNFGDFNTSTATSPTHIYNFDDTLTVTLFANSNLNCADTLEKTVYIFPSPVSSFIINDSAQCFNEHAFTFTNHTAINSGAISHFWDLDDGNNSTQTNVNHNYSYDDTFNVKLVNTSDLGCKDSLTKNVYLFPSPQLDFAINDSQQCFNENNFVFTNNSLINSGSQTYLWNFGDFNTSTTTSPTHIYNFDDTLTVTLFANSNLNCADTLEKTVYIFPSPVSSFIINDSAQCFNEHAFTFTNHTSINSGTLSYFWDLDDGNTSTQTNVSHNYAYDDTFNVKLVNTSDLGCKDSLTKNVYLFPSPQLDFAINDSQQCFNENNFVFTNNSLINTGSQTFLWNFGDFNTSTTTSPTHIYNFDDTLTVTLFANSNLNCADTLEKTVYIFPSPVSSFIINDSAQCFNEHAFTFTNHTSINSGTLSYFWDLDDGNNSTQTNVNHNYSYDDTFNVKLVNTSDLGCKDSLTKNVYLFPSPQLDFAINDSQQCFNENNFVFTNNSLINSGSQTYLWNFGDFNTSTTTSPTHIYNFDDTLTVTLFANSNLNCADTLEKTVYIFPSPVSSFIINDSDQCFNEHAFTFTNHTSINSGTLSYFWDLDDGNTSTQTNVNHNYAYDDTFNVKLVNTSDLGCKDSLTKKAYVFPSPVPDFVVNDTDQCFSGNNFVFTNQTTINTGSSTYSWNFGDMTTSSQTSPSKSYSAYDTFDVTMIATSYLNCQDTTSAQMIVFPMPEAGFTINDSDQCLRDNYYQFTDNSHIPYGSFTHFWNLGESTTSTSQNPTHKYSNFDSITIGLWVTSSHGCADSSFKNIVINPMPTASFIVNDSTQCFRNNRFDFTNTSVIPHGSLSAEWFFGDGDTSQTYNPKHPYSYPDTFPVSMIISSEEGCKDTAYSNSYVFHMPVAEFSINDSTQCFRYHQVNLTNNSTITAGNLSYNWNLGDGNTSTNFSLNHQYAIADSYDIQLVATSENNCFDTISKQVIIFPMPQANFVIWDSAQCFEDNAFGFQNQSNISSGSLSFCWEFGDNDTSCDINPVHSYSYADTFIVTLVAKSDNDCYDTTSATTYLHVNPEPVADFIINDSAQCLRGNDFDFTNLSIIKSGSFSSYWYYGDGYSENLFDTNYSYSNHDTYSVILLVISDKGCKDSIVKTNIVYPMPVTNFSIDNNSQCLFGNQFSFFDSSTIASGNLSYYWDYGDNQTTTDTHTNHSYSHHDTFNVLHITTSALGCIDSMTQKVYVHPMPQADFVVIDSIQCLRYNQFSFYDSSSIDYGSISYLWDFDDLTTSNSQNPVHHFSYYDSFDVKLKVASLNGCSDSATKQMVVHPMPVAGFDINDSQQCYNQNYFSFSNTSSISYGFNNYQWNFGDLQTSFNSNPNHFYLYDDTFDVLLVATSNYNCIDSLEKTVFVFPSPNLSLYINDSMQCFNENNFTFSNNSLINSGSQAYLWDFGDGDTSSIHSPAHIYTTDDTFSVVLFANSNLNCKDTLIKTVYVFPSPESDFNVNDSMQCFNENSFILTNNSTINSGTQTYLWTFGNRDSSILSSLNYQYQTDDTFDIKLLNTSNLGCQDSMEKTVYVFPSPELDFTVNDSSQCFNENNFSFTNHSTINTGSQTYNWDFDDGNSTPQENTTHIYNSDDTFNVVLYAISDLNCPDTLQKAIIVKPSPEPAFSINDSMQCFNEHEYIFTNNSTINTGTQSYLWNLGNSTTSTQKDIVYEYTRDDTFTIKLVNTSNLGCKDSISKIIYLFPSPQLNFVINDSIQCFNENNFNFTNNSLINSGNLTYLWDFGDNDTSTSINPNHIFAYNDTFLITLFGNSDLNCTDTLQKTVYLFPSPETDFTINDSSQCFNEHSFEFTNNSSINSGTETYEWDLGDGTTSSSTSITHKYSYDDTFSIKLLSTSNLGCLDSTIKTIYLHPTPLPGFSINDTIQCLNGNQFDFTNNTTINSGSINYYWTFGDNNSSTNESPSHTYASENSYNIMMIATSDVGCPDTAFASVDVYPSPNADFSISDSSQCLLNNLVLFIDNSSINSGTWNRSWDLGDGNTAFQSGFSHTYAYHDSFKVKLILNSNLNCQDSITKNVFIHPMPNADFGMNSNSQCLAGNDFHFTNTSNIDYGTLSYQWNFGDGNGSSSDNPHHSYNIHKNYPVSLIVTSGNNCQDTATKKAFVRPMPTAEFTIDDSSQCLRGNNFSFSNLTTVSYGWNEYLWEFGDGTFDTNMDISHVYNFIGTKRVKLTATTNHNCIDTFSETLTLWPMPWGAFAVNDTTQCLDWNSFEFTNQSLIPYGNLSYKWKFGDGSSSTDQNPTHSYSVDSNYYPVRMIVSSEHLCRDTVYSQSIVYPMPKARFNFTTPCLNDTVKFTDKSTIKSPEILDYWEWDFDDGSFSFNRFAENQYQNAGDYFVKLIVGSTNMCYDTTTRKLHFYEKVPAPVLDRVTVLNDESILIDWLPVTQGRPLLYNIEKSIDGNNYGLLSTSPPYRTIFEDENVFVDNQSYYYRVNVIDSCNFQSPNSNLGKSILLQSYLDEDKPTLSWSFYEDWSAGVSFYEILSFNAKNQIYEQIGTAIATDSTFVDPRTETINQPDYCYIVAAHRNGDDTISYSNQSCVPTPFNIYAPTAFTPNPNVDDLNNTYVVKGTFVVYFHLQIFDRWGRMVFESFDMDNQWDGTYEGRDLPMDVYYVQIEAEGTGTQKKVLRTTVSLIR